MICQKCLTIEQSKVVLIFRGILVRKNLSYQFSHYFFNFSTQTVFFWLQ